MRTARLIFVLLLGICALAPVRSLAQGAPGPMTRAHKDLSSFPVDCNKCHEAGYGVPDDKCLACHTHQPLRARIRAGKGFHAAPDVKKQACKDCHAEHKEEPPGSGKGRRTSVDWRPFGGQRNFDHGLTGWPLEGTHRFQKCEKCHDKKYPETKLTTYLGERAECTTCHFGTEKKPGVGGFNPHKFTDVALTDCKLCHTFSNFQVANLAATKFDHDKTDYPLKGEHLRNKCVACHEKNIETFEIKDVDFSDCKGCHEDSHRSVISAKRDCKSCHLQSTKFRKTRFDHAKETKFPLRGKHAKNRCKDCHKIDSPPEAPAMACVTCHEDIHKGRFGKETCEGCHVDLGFEQMVYDHDKKTKMELSGVHKTTKCTNCHRFGLAQKFERFETTTCADCHRHQEAHCGQFGMENCERCHVRGGDRTSKFDHSLTKFPLERAHADVDCERCHKPAELGKSKECRNTVKYTGLEPQCATCHEDIHKGELGQECNKCHTGGENFRTLVFDHNRDARFPLTGFHQVVECNECHPGRKYKLGEYRCYSCHEKDDVHATVLGDDCSKCHETTGGAPTFNHDVHTDFARYGVHARVECERCHFLNPDGGSYADELKKLKAELSGTSTAGPESGEEELMVIRDRVARLPVIAPAGAPLDLKFRSAGAACEDCHPDPHKVRDNLDCGSCHGFEQWTAPEKNGYHESAGFALVGAHQVVACSLCHLGSGSLKGRGERCGGCHAQDDIHAGSFGADCGRCHEQQFWVPTTFTHVDTGYVLEGIHRTLECRQCHQAGNYFIGSNCYNCHLADYREADWHKGFDADLNRGKDVFIIHGGFNAQERSLDCDACHNQFTFARGTYTNAQSP